jgi:hypothetical protein
MKIERTWVSGGLPNLYYYTDEKGRIIGETGIVGTGNTNKFSTAVYPGVSTVHSLGMYISSITAQNAIELWWSKEDSVYDMMGTILEKPRTNVE